MEKIYCNTCKHIKKKDVGFSDWDECKANPMHRDSYFHHFVVMHHCNKKNAQNDCPDYEAKRSWFELINFIRFPIL